MSDPATLLDSLSATSSQAWAPGPSLSDEQVGQMIAESGLPVALANLSHRRAKVAGWEMSGICGPLCSTSSSSASLQSALESRLRARTQNLGSTLFKLTWKSWATPSGVSRSRLRASALRTSETACTGWPTPMAGTPAQNGNNAAGNNDYSRRVVELSGWPTAAARDWKGATKERWGTNARPLNEVAVLAGWSTPLANDATGGSMAHKRADGTYASLSVDRQAAQLVASGPTPTGSPAAMGSSGQLNPAHSRWLMGLPPEWDACAPMAMPSSRRKPKSGSKP